MDSQTFNQVTQMIIILIVMIAGLKVERHVTKQEVNRLLDIAQRLASKTKTTIDDILIGFARMLNNLRPSRGEDEPTETVG